MKRQMKFRGRDLKTGKWVYGDLLAPITGCRIVNYTEVDNGSMKRADYHYHDVDGTTVGQFTGLLDRNGKEIYEGDVVEIISYYTSPREKEMSRTRAVIMFDETLACFLGKSKSASFAMTCASNMEVVGNIHEQSKS